MDTIILRYMTPFLTPLQQLQYDSGLETHKRLTKDLEKYIDHFGFPGKKIIDLVNSKRDTYISGSFILDFLTQKNKHKWVANDIDMFTSSVQCSIDLMKTQFTDEPNIVLSSNSRRDSRYSAEEKMYTSQFKTNIVYFDEFVNNVTEKYFQLITVKNAKDTILNNFDLDIIKVRFNGQEFKIEPESLHAIQTKTSYVKSVHGTSYMLNRSLQRAEKYTSRGYKIYLPTQVMLLSSDDVPRAWTTKTYDIYECDKSQKQIQSINHVYWKKRDARHTQTKIDVNLSFYSIKIKDISRSDYPTYETSFEPPAMSLK